jgi:diguanylate cyclase (GGDEF)-like protein/PAS domain S-box-containing protein
MVRMRLFAAPTGNFSADAGPIIIATPNGDMIKPVSPGGRGILGANVKKLILLLTEDDSAAHQLAQILDQTQTFTVERLSKIVAAIARLRANIGRKEIDGIIVDLTLSDMTGLHILEQLSRAAPHTPILTLCSDENESLAVEAYQHGAQGYLSKGHIKSHLVAQALGNIIAHRVIEEALYLEKSRAEITLNSISDAVISTNTAGQVDYMNEAAEILTGWTRQQAMGRPIDAVFQLIHATTREATPNSVDLVLRFNKPMGMKADTVLIRRDGNEAPIEDSASPIHDRQGRVAGAVLVFHDVSAAKAMTIKMTHLAHHDFLTDLPNRVLLNDRISQAIAVSERLGTSLALLFLDLDNFKHINDSLGHDIGDLLLQSVTQRLLKCVRDSDTVCRLGGDEFIILLLEGQHAEKSAVVANAIVDALRLPHHVGKYELHATVSIGISTFPQDGFDATTLIKNADTAMYHAKDKGRNNYQFFSTSMNNQAVQRQSLEAKLRFALTNHEFEVYYQPKIDLRSGAITGAEALLRWPVEYGKKIDTQQLVAVAEDCGIIIPLGQWVLSAACRQAQCWDAAGFPALSIAVNISALEFRQQDFFSNLLKIIASTGIAPHRLQLEITESVLMQDIDLSFDVASNLKQMGIRLAMDDFGTGYSSLSYLKKFPIDILKIDQSFINDIDATPDNGVIVAAVLGMCNRLHKQVIAEGVENQTQLRFLCAHHCDEGQGYLFSQPIDATQFGALLNSWSPVKYGDDATP